MGIQTTEGNLVAVFNDNFEIQSVVGELPFTCIPISLSSIEENTWYLTNEHAKLSVREDHSRTCRYSLECSADLGK